VSFHFFFAFEEDYLHSLRKRHTYGDVQSCSGRVERWKHVQLERAGADVDSVLGGVGDLR
jgi:hypothetical protein